MNKTVIIIGSVALLGVGAYLYFKGKAKPNEETMGTGTTGMGTTGTGTAMQPTGTVLTTPKETQIEPLNFLQEIKLKEAQRILDWVIKNKPSIAETELKFKKIKALGFNVVGSNLVPIS